ncbi:MAG: hypothetical protein NTV61_05465 [Candidatus Bathyarchaeota archaeon]|nr:hypothetical protein [Candidatus Bathyarchaeota archaeon]
MKSERDFRNYLAGAALAFGIVLLSSQILQLLFGGNSVDAGSELYGLIVNIYLSAHLVGGFAGGYLVARVKNSDFIQVGTVTAILAYIFEFIYNIVVESATTDIYAAVSLLIGGIIGAMFFRARTERGRITSAKKPEEPKTAPEAPKQG